MIYYYLLASQCLANTYNYVYSSLIGVKEVKTIMNGQIHNMTPRFVLYNIMKKINNVTTEMVNFLNVETDKVQLTKVTPEGEVTFIMDDNVCFDKVSKKLSETVISDKMVVGNVISISLESNSNSYPMKDLLIKYKDFDEKNKNTVKNVLDFNMVIYDEELDIINIKKLESGKIKCVKKPLKDALSLHLNRVID